MGESETADPDKIASHTLAFLRRLEKKVDLVLESQARQNERLGRVEREVGESRLHLDRGLAEVRRDLLELRSDTVLFENRLLNVSQEVLTIVRKLDGDTEAEGAGPG